MCVCVCEWEYVCVCVCVCLCARAHVHMCIREGAKETRREKKREGDGGIWLEEIEGLGLEWYISIMLYIVEIYHSRLESSKCKRLTPSF